jgi:drug/metabolite transporter (DMT)-like permease
MTEQKTIVRRAHLDGLAVSLLIVCCLFWGAQQVLIKATLTELPPFFQASLRFIGATALLMLWCKWRDIPLWGRDGSFKPGLIAGLLFAVEFASIYTGLQFTSASRLTVFLYTSPFWVAVLVPLWVPSEKMGKWQWLGLILAFCGVTVAFFDGFQNSQLGYWKGDLLALLAGLGWGLSTVVIRTSVMAKLSPEKMLFYQSAMCAVLFPFVSWIFGERWTNSWSGFATSSMIIQTVIGAFLSFLVWMWMLSRYPATKLSSFVFLTPISALLIGSLWLGETLTLSLLAGLACVAVGVLLVNRKS